MSIAAFLGTVARQVPVVCWVGALLLCASASVAQTFPSKPVRLIAGMAAGGGADVNARRLADHLSRMWGQPVVVDNRAGGAGNLAAVAVANATPDGYTLLFASHPMLAVNPLLHHKLPFNADRDFAPVVLVSKTPHILLANASLRASTLSELVALAKERPGSLNFGSGGPGTSIHLAAELFKSAAGIELTHVPYKGAAPAVAALIGGEIQLLFDSSMTAIGHLRSGRVRGLAITSLTRSAAVPDLPTFDESGFRGFEAGVSHGILVPSSTPAAIVSELNRSINKALSNPEYRRQMGESGVALIGGSPKDFKSYLDAERKMWGEVIRRQGITAM